MKLSSLSLTDRQRNGSLSLVEIELSHDTLGIMPLHYPKVDKRSADKIAPMIHHGLTGELVEQTRVRPPLNSAISHVLQRIAVMTNP